MKTEAYAEHGRWVTDHIAPINAVMTISTAVLIPPPDVLRPYSPYIGYVAGLAVLVSPALLVMRVLGIPRGKQLQTGIVIYSGVCVAASSVGAVASARHADQDGVIAVSTLWVVQLRQTLLDMKDGKNDNPRVEFKNMGVKWTSGNLLQTFRDGDAKMVELFLKRGMPVTLSGTGNDRQLPFYVVASNYLKAKEQPELFKENGMDLNDPQLAVFNNTDLSIQPSNLYAVAKDYRREELASYLAELGMKTDGYPIW